MNKINYVKVSDFKKDCPRCGDPLVHEDDGVWCCEDWGKGCDYEVETNVIPCRSCGENPVLIEDGYCDIKDLDGCSCKLLADAEAEQDRTDEQAMSDYLKRNPNAKEHDYY